MTDPISDMITRIRNAANVQKDSLVLPYSKLKEAILGTLQKEGYVTAVEKKGKGVKKLLKVELAYVGNTSRIAGMKRVSKQSQRRYAGANDLDAMRGGKGLLVLTTPKGVMTDKDAKTQKVGGEVIMKIW